jgi:hypothetical protein
MQQLNNKQQILALLANAQQLIEESNWHCDSIANGSNELEECKSEMLGKLEAAAEAIGYYLDD